MEVADRLRPAGHGGFPIPDPTPRPEFPLLSRKCRAAATYEVKRGDALVIIAGSTT